MNMQEWIRKRWFLYIEGEPFINTVPIETGLTNAVIKNAGSRVVGLNSENPELHEGMI